MTLTRKFLHIGATALMLSTVASVTTFVTADAAYAERGNGNGNGNGRANRDRERPQSGSRGNGNGRGAVASELKWMNAAHANQNALENASPNSRPGQLYVLQQESVEADIAAIDEADALQALLDEGVTNADGELLTEEDIAAMTDEELTETFGDELGGNYAMARAAADAAQGEVDALLLEFTDGEGLSEEALEELERLLRIAELVEAAAG